LGYKKIIILFKYIKVIADLPVYYLSKIFPKKKNLSIIGSSLGLHFADNPKYFYIDYYRRNHFSSNLVWISKSKLIVNNLKEKGYPSEYLYSAKGLYIVLRASRAYISHQLDDINGALMGGAQIIQLWHGMPLKKIGYGGDWNDSNFAGKLKSFVFKWFPYSYYMKCDILFAPSKEAKKTYLESFSKSFRNSKISENILLVRQARTFCFDKDFLLTSEFFPEINLLNSFSNKFDKIISWLPTHRAQLGKTIIDVISDSNLNLEGLNNFLESQNYLFVIKPHFLDYNELKNITKVFDFITVYPHVDAYPLLKFTDILVTDYSSVFFDFLLTDRLIIFMNHDFEEYVSATGSFYYNYENLDIGPICFSWEHVIEVISNHKKYKERFSININHRFQKFSFASNKNVKESIIKQIN